MGVEDFQVILTCDKENLSDIIKKLKSIPKVNIDEMPNRLGEEEYFLIDDGNHLIEVEVSSKREKKNSIRISCRFALCHPSSINKIFYKFIRDIGQQLKMNIEILDEVPLGLSDKFDYPEYKGLDIALEKAIELKKKYWIQDFGPEIASLRTSDALKRYVLNDYP